MENKKYHENIKSKQTVYHAMYVCTQRRLMVSPVKNNENFRLNGIVSSSVSSSLLLNSSSPKIIVREYGGDGLSGSSGSKKPGFNIIFGMRSSVSHSSSVQNKKRFHIVIWRLFGIIFKL